MSTRHPAARAAALVLAALLAGCASMRQAPPDPGATPEPATPPPQEPVPEEPASPTPPPSPTPEPEPQPPPPPTAAAAAAPPPALRYVQGAEYRASSIQTYRTAGRELERLAEVLEPRAWAVVLDVDETVLSNAPFERERAAAGETTFNRARWNAWVARRAAEPLSGAVAFLERVRELGGVVALVTNRAQELCPATEDNLRTEGVPYDLILCRPSGSDGEKEPRWDSVREGTAAGGLPPLEIVMYLGDNIQDFPGLDQRLRSAPEEDFEDFGSLYFVVPNPLYGSWERAAD